ncbi:Cystathionine gamma-lyase [Candidatus Koribacter versatilis Ellin345]|uniref:Cystathionine gamma-lyase n=1 Tax=Koribacter versatilis (strain Ellin345) TaxID=204669 RepID=Q1ITX7_KORVE|nr:PLP-dependent transferase [Candidatus Koribacter versatilis]ABF39673.1 Cystathionine gamma-lyase [Candidatus Koribacter versatilis Ellin345]
MPTTKARKAKPSPKKPQAEAHDNQKYDLRTRLIHGSMRTPKWDYSHHVVPPLTSSATFRLSSSQRGARGFFEFACDTIDTTRQVPIYIYDRLDEPTRGMLEENLAAAEAGEMGVCFATGMAAISASICALTRAGDQVVAHNTLYGCTYSLMTNWLPRQGVATRFVDMRNPKEIAKAINAHTRIVYFETPVNPNLELIDIAAVREIVDHANKGRSELEQIRVVVDNTFATPFCQRPLTLGAHMVVHSLTKGIGGFGTDMGGVVIGPKSLHNVLLMYRKDFGGSLSPKPAWNVLVYGLPSLAARMANMQKTAQYVAEWLEQHPKVEKVFYPGLESFPQRDLAETQMVDYRGKFAPGSMVYFTLRDKSGENHAAEKFINYVADKGYCITLAVSLGQIKTLIENPYSMTHSAYLAVDTNKAKKNGHGRGCETNRVEPGGIRLSIGLEDRDDIIADLESGLEHA